MKLISMTDLVLQGYNINQINNYAKFLKQPLKLEMFEGKNVLLEYHLKNSHHEIMFHNDTVEDLAGNGFVLTEYAINLLGL